MRVTLEELAEVLRQEGEEAVKERFGHAFLVADPASAFNLSSGPMQTMRVDRQAFLASSRGEFHPSAPVFLLLRRPESVYSFISIGRTDNCDITLHDDTISKLHALIREKDGEYSAQDADSANGSFRGEEPIPRRNEGAPMVLASKDILRFGQIKLHFMMWDDLRALIEDVVPAS